MPTVHQAGPVRSGKLLPEGPKAAAEEKDVSGKTLEETLAWRLVWLMGPESGGGPFLI
jgi:hypothetical protein